MSDQEARAARGRTPKPNLREEAGGVYKKRVSKPPSPTALDTSRRPAAEASYGAPPAESARIVARTVFGSDHRVQVPDTTVYPYSAIADVSMTFQDGATSWGGTAWFIGPYTLMTAGHNVYSPDPTYDWAASIKVMPGRDGGVLPFGWIMASNWDAAYGWKHGGDENFDYGVIVIPAALGNTVDWFGFHAMSDHGLLNTTANVCGYPGDKDDGTTMWCDAEPISRVDEMNVYYETDTEGAMSGSPVYYEESGRAYAVAVHNYGGTSANSGRRITDDVFEWMKAWKDDPFG